MNTSRFDHYFPTNRKRLMALSAKTAKSIIWTAFLVRIFSQLIWEMYPTVNLNSYEFLSGLIIATYIWLELELPRVLTCLIAASSYYAYVKLASNRSTMTSYASFAGKCLVFICISCVHAYSWIFIDCQSFYHGTLQEGECIRIILSPPDPSLFFSS